MVVDEVGIGEIMNIKGKNTYQVFPKELMAYATLRDTGAPKNRQLITIEKYNNREYDAYRKIQLSDKEQKKMFGRTIKPIDWTTIIFIVIFIAIILFAFIFDNNSDNSNGGGHCGSRSVYGGSSGGLGK